MSWTKSNQNHGEKPVSGQRFKSAVEWFWFALILIGAWSLLSMAIHNSLICPSPWQTLEQMALQIQRPDFVLILLSTIARSLEALLFSALCGLFAAFVSAFFSWSTGFLNRLVSLMQTIPNVCYIILLLFWTSREQTVILTGFFLLFPLIYRTLYEQLKALQAQYAAVWTIYPQPAWVRMFVICLPMLKPAIGSAIKSASSLAFKVVVTSEILTGLMPGIGKSLQIARLDLNPAGVAAWSLWLILIVFGFEKLWGLLISRLFGSGE